MDLITLAIANQYADQKFNNVSQGDSSSSSTTIIINDLKNELQTYLNAAFITDVYDGHDLGGQWAQFEDGANGVPLEKFILDICGDEEPNLDIDQTGVKITQCGKNILRLPTYSELISCNHDNDYYIYPIKAKPNGASYYLSVSFLDDYTIENELEVIFSNNVNDIAISNDTSGIFLYSPVDGYFHLYVYMETLTQEKWNLFLEKIQIQLEEGAIATQYEPYSGKTYTIDWSNEIGHVETGILDILNGVLTVEGIKIILTGDEMWNFNADDGYFYTYINIPEKAHENYEYAYIITKNDIILHMVPFTNEMRIYLSENDSLQEDNDIASIVSGDKFILYFDTPKIIQLHPTKVTSLYGENYFYTDIVSQHYLEVTYRCDPKLYIARIGFENNTGVEV